MLDQTARLSVDRMRLYGSLLVIFAALVGAGYQLDWAWLGFAAGVAFCLSAMRLHDHRRRWLELTRKKPSEARQAPTIADMPSSSPDIDIARPRPTTGRETSLHSR